MKELPVCVVCVKHDLCLYWLSFFQTVASSLAIGCYGKRTDVDFANLSLHLHIGKQEVDIFSSYKRELCGRLISLNGLSD